MRSWLVGLLLVELIAGVFGADEEAVTLDCYECEYTKTGTAVTGAECEDPGTGGATSYRNNTGDYCQSHCYTLSALTPTGTKTEEGKTDKDGFIERGCFDNIDISLSSCTSGKVDNGFTVRKLKCCGKSLCNSSIRHLAGWASSVFIMVAVKQLMMPLLSSDD